MLSLQRTADIAVAPFFIQLIGYDDGIRINSTTERMPGPFWSISSMRFR
jgi:hypothetical protein